MKKITAVLLSVFMCFMLTACNKGTGSGELLTDIIDVGKGDCILIRTENKTVMIDTGYKDTADRVKEYLRGKSVQKIDTLIITHYDRDHVGGAAKLLKDYKADKIYVPDYEDSEGKCSEFLQAAYEQDIDTEKVTDSVSFKADNADIRINASGCEYMSGADGSEGNDNDMSLIVSVENGDDSYLFAGDIENEGIEKYTARENKHYDILKMPHHGELCDDTEKLLDSVTPKTALITDGKGDKMDKKLKKLLESRGIAYYSTRKNGDITIKSGGKGEYELETEE